MLNKLLTLLMLNVPPAVLLDNDDFKPNVAVCVFGTEMDNGAVAGLFKDFVIVAVALRSASESNCKRG